MPEYLGGAEYLDGIFIFKDVSFGRVEDLEDLVLDIPQLLPVIIGLHGQLGALLLKFWTFSGVQKKVLKFENKVMEIKKLI